MKAKPYDRKLVFSRETIAHLDIGEKKAVEGGGGPICATVPALTCRSFNGWTCYTCDTGYPACMMCI
jgi:hypothetical protein